MNSATSSSAPLECYLLLGQSNMAGRGLVQEEDKKPVRNILVFDSQDKWVNQGEPIHYDSPRSGVGLGMALAKQRVKRNPQTRIGLIPCAVGGTPLALWQPGADLYLKSIRRAKLALSGGILRGFLWHQGGMILWSHRRPTLMPKGSQGSLRPTAKIWLHPKSPS